MGGEGAPGRMLQEKKNGPSRSSTNFKALRDFNFSIENKIKKKRAIINFQIHIFMRKEI